MSCRTPASIQSLERRQLLADATAAASHTVLADMNGDGKADAIHVARVPRTADVSVSIAIGNGAGRFRLSDRIILRANTAFAVGVGDLDGDGATDVAVAGDNPLSMAPVNGTYVLTAFGNGDGKFKRASTSTTPNAPLLRTDFVAEIARARAVTLADLDDNGFGEVSVLGTARSSTSPAPETHAIVVNWDPTLPTFAPVPPTVVAFNSLTYLNQLHVADLDRDGKLDLVATHRTPLPPSVLTVMRYDLATVQFPADHTAVVKRGVNPLNAFPPAPPSSASPVVETFAVGSLNDDAIPELIGRRDNVVRYASYTGGNALFGPPQAVASTNSPPGPLTGFRAGDITGDGLTDVLANSRFGPVLATNITQPDGAVTVRWSRVSIFSQLEIGDHTEAELAAPVAAY